MPAKCDLTYFAARRRWKNKYRGKVHNVGPSAVTKSDREAYREAKAEWSSAGLTLHRLGIPARDLDIGRFRQGHSHGVRAVRVNS
jgi:hypothetical protein